MSDLSPQGGRKGYAASGDETQVAFTSAKQASALPRPSGAADPWVYKTGHLARHAKRVTSTARGHGTGMTIGKDTWKGYMRLGKVRGSGMSYPGLHGPFSARRYNENRQRIIKNRTNKQRPLRHPIYDTIPMRKGPTNAKP